jgi:hypothetical protein
MFTGATCGEAMTAATSTSETSAEGIRKPEILRARSALWVLRMFPPLGLLVSMGFPHGGCEKNASLEGFHRTRTSPSASKSLR